MGTQRLVLVMYNIIVMECDAEEWCTMDEEGKGTHKCVCPRLSKEDASMQVGRR